MRVLMFGWEFPPLISGGLGTACFGLTRELSKRHLDLTFVLPRFDVQQKLNKVRILGADNLLMDYKLGGGGLSASYRERLANVTFIQSDARLQPYARAPFSALPQISSAFSPISNEVTSLAPQLRMAGGASAAGGGQYQANIYDEIEKLRHASHLICATESFDVIHAHDWMTYAAAIEAKNITGKPLVVHVHSMEFDRSGDHPNSRIMKEELRGLRHADRIIAVSDYTKSNLVRRYHIPPENITTVHNGIDVHESTTFSGVKPLGEVLIMFMGRITFQKGPEYFVEAAKLVYDRCDHVRFVMAGSGDALEGMIRKVAALKMQDRFHFSGFLGPQEVEKIYGMSDLYVMPSVSEPFGLTAMEASRFHVPVIISKQSGISEVLDHVLKVDFWDVQKLADCMMAVVRHPSLRQALVRHNQLLKHHSWQASAAKVHYIYKELAE